MPSSRFVPEPNRSPIEETVEANAISSIYLKSQDIPSTVIAMMPKHQVPISEPI